MTKYGPFRIQKLTIKNFHSGDYLGINGKELNGKSLFVYGTNSTGKSTSFDAIIYSIFGIEFIDRPINIADTRIILYNGEITIEIERKYNSEPKVKIESEEIKGSRQVYQKMREYLSIPEKTSNAKMLINALVLQQKDEHTVLSKYSKNQLYYIITSFSSGTSISERIEEIEKNIKDSQSKLEQFEFKKRDALKEISDWMLMIRRNTNYFNDIKQFIEQYESGELNNSIEVLEKNKEIKQIIGRLFSKRTKKYSELHEIGVKLNNSKQYYNKELMEVIKQTLAVLICPVCGDNLDLNKVDGRKDKKMCPFCGKEHYTGDLYERLNTEISISNEKLNGVSEQKRAIEEDLKNIDDEIDIIKRDQLGIQINPVIFRIISNNVEQNELKEKYESYNLLLTKYIEELENSTEQVEVLNKFIGGIEVEKTNVLNTIRKSNEEKTHIIDDENSKNVQEFNLQLNTVFKKLIKPLPHKLNIQDNCVILDTANAKKDCSDKYALGYSEKKLVDFALWTTFQKMNLKNNVLNINFGLLDDIFENIDNNEIKWKTNLYSILNNMDKDIQLILFSIDKQMNDNLKLSTEYKLQFQSNFERFVE